MAGEHLREAVAGTAAARAARTAGRGSRRLARDGRVRGTRRDVRDANRRHPRPSALQVSADRCAASCPRPRAEAVAGNVIASIRPVRRRTSTCQQATQSAASRAGERFREAATAPPPLGRPHGVRPTEAGTHFAVRPTAASVGRGATCEIRAARTPRASRGATAARSRGERFRAQVVILVGCSGCHCAVAMAVLLTQFVAGTCVRIAGAGRDVAPGCRVDAVTLADCSCGNVDSRRLRMINRAVIQTSSHNR